MSEQEEGCEHTDALEEAMEDLVILSFNIERGLEGKSAEEKLGYAMNAVHGVIYAIAHKFGIEHFSIVMPDGRVAMFTPVKLDMPAKEQLN